MNGATSGELAPFGFGASQQYTLVDAPLAVTDVTLDFLSRGDLEEPTERVTAFVGSTFVGFLYESTGTLCSSDPAMDQIVVPASVWNAASVTTPL